MAAILYTPEELLSRARLGAKLRAKERLEVVLWLEKTGEYAALPEGKLAQDLGCKVGSLRKLRAKAKQTLAAAISPEEAMTYMAEYLRLQDLVIAEATQQIKQAPGGSQLHQGYLRLLMEASGEKIAKLQSIGVIPKELGRLTTISEEWVATIADDVATVQPKTTEGEHESV
jgi:hypothetical protein